MVDRIDEVVFDTFRREQDAERGIFDGWLTALINLEDIRVGDIIDYGTTTEIIPPLDPNLFFDGFPVEAEVPVGLIRRKITWPRDEKLAIEALRTNLQPRISTDAGMSVYLWEVSNPIPVKIEANRPSRVRSRGIVEISSTPDWSQIADAARPYYTAETTLPDNFQAKLDRIAADHAAPADRLVQALRLVQEDIRYVSLSIGDGSHIPRRPATVISSGFGDCKDKALLLMSSLRKLGIEAYAALTDIDHGHSLDTGLPAIGAFDHVIVKAVVGGETFWVDPTDYLQGGSATNLVPPDYGFALPITDQPGGQLEKIGRKALGAPTREVHERFVFPIEEGEPLSLMVETTYRGYEADRSRKRISSKSPSSVTNEYLEYYNKQYPGLQSLDTIAVSDDLAANTLTVRESYSLPATALAANGLVNAFPLKADIGYDDLPTPSSLNRIAPVALGFPIDRRHKISVSNLKATFTLSENGDVETPDVKLKISWSSTSTTFDMEWHLRTLTDEVPPADVAAYLDAVNKIGQNAYWTYDFGYAAPEPQPNMDSGEAIALVALGIALLMMVAAAIYELTARKAVPGQHYVPMPPGKFVFMVLITWGLYGIWWAWRGFWQQKVEHGARIWPFWRALFYPFWMLPMFMDVNARLGEKRLPLWLGIGATVLALATWISGYTAEWLFEPPPWLLPTQIVMTSVELLPLLVAVNRLNDFRPSRGLLSAFTIRDLYMIVFGLLMSGSTLYLEYAVDQAG